MILIVGNRKIDTETDLNAAERHILQKLILWAPMVNDIKEFREKRDEALKKGWNNSGPIKPSENLMMIIRDLETKIIKRLSKV